MVIWKFGRVGRNSKIGNTASDGDVHVRKERNPKDDYVEPNEENEERQTKKEGE